MDINTALELIQSFMIDQDIRKFHLERGILPNWTIWLRRSNEDINAVGSGKTIAEAFANAMERYK